MPIRINLRHFLQLAFVVICMPGLAGAQAAATPEQPRIELGVDYNFVHSNAPPGGCSCFNLNGGGVNLAWPIAKGGFAVVGDVSVTHASSISSGGYSLTLGTYTAGIRYRAKLGHSLIHPFGEATVGVAHASGSLVEGSDASVSNSGGSFALITGGGVDLRATRRLWFRLIDADYVMTNFDNGSNNRQNNLRIAAGVIFRF